MRWSMTAIAIVAILCSPAAAMTTSDCFDCHSDDSLSKMSDGRELSLFVDEALFGASIHGDMDCVDCHADLDGVEDEHEEALEPVDCTMCHDETGEEMAASAHSPAVARVDKDLPRCADCHGKHDIMPTDSRNSRVCDLNIPATCCACHSSEEVASRHPGLDADVCSDYEEGMHGKVLIRSGLILTAVCTDCHGSHGVLPVADEASSVAFGQVNQTCGNCHAGVLEQYQLSAHGQLFAEGMEEAPTCATCHGSHLVERAMDIRFLTTITEETCARCHEEEAHTFAMGYHGKVTAVGYPEAAQCPDCHGSHNILSSDDPASLTHPDNLPATCGACHPGSNPSFAMYDPHANYHDRENYPILYYVFLFMVTLLAGTFAFFGIHTLLWFIRAQIEKVRQG